MRQRLNRKKARICQLTGCLACLVLLRIFVCPAPVNAEDLAQSIRENITSKDAVILAGTDGRILVSVNADRPVIPASTLKVLTALAAFHYLGEDYRYPTDFYLDATSNLIIKGYGDPLMISEEIRKIAAQLKPMIRQINEIVVDDTFFDASLHIPGTTDNSIQPYDAPIGAVCVNFNTVNFKKQHNTILSAESQTPLVPLARKKILAMAPDIKTGRVLLTHDHDDIIQYAGELFADFLRAEGITIAGGIRRGKVDENRDRLIYRHRSSHDLRDIVARLLEYSNNFIANQLLLTIGAEADEPPATLEKGVSAVREYARERFNCSGFSYAEGSGISRENRITAAMFLDILKAFRPYHALMPKENDEYFKTGTLKGISTRVGYVMDPEGGLLMFGIFINTPGRTTSGVMADMRRSIARLASPNKPEGPSR